MSGRVVFKVWDRLGCWMGWVGLDEFDGMSWLDELRRLHRKVACVE